MDTAMSHNQNRPLSSPCLKAGASRGLSVNSLKTVTSRRLKNEFPEIRGKLWKDKFWTAGYFVVTAGGAPLDAIKQYVENQGL